MASPEGYVLLRISKVMEAEAGERSQDTERRLSAALGAAQYKAYVESLRGQADIEVRALSPEKK